MVDGNKDVELYERVSALEENIKICMPQIYEELKRINYDINDGLKSEVRGVSEKLDTHIEIQGLKDLADKGKLEKKAKANMFWLVFIRIMITGTALALIGIFFESILK
jgi:hypothetical protein